MINSIEQYLSELKQELAGSDRATVQDALSDAEEYLRTALANAAKDDAPINEADALAQIIEKYGTPKEIAAAYKDIESRTPPAFNRPKPEEIKIPAAPAPPAPACPSPINDISSPASSAFLPSRGPGGHYYTSYSPWARVSPTLPGR